MHGPAGVSLPRARALDVALHAVAAHATVGATGAGDPAALAGAPAVWLPAGPCAAGPPRPEVRVAHRAARAAQRGPADHRSGSAAQDAAAARGEDQVRWRQ